MIPLTVVRSITLTQGKETWVDQDDFLYLSEFSWYAVYTRGLTFYACRSASKKIDGKRKKYLMHRVIMGVVETTKPDVDHINRNGLNNCRSNLRTCTRSVNARNRIRPNMHKTSIYRGVSWYAACSRKWKAQIVTSSGYIYLGSHHKEIDAAIEYDKAALLHFGPTAITNFPAENYRA